ncbi:MULTISPECIES: SPFH domain-containing protein [unclassified Oleiphilus]|uniref:SPFH domain-containing protein n=1 Tax=unclassified Oleiphilus TaxID=2631174 RepID=UPI001E391EC7|nr:MULTISPECIES: SPFH domain-containing protein [unclassified Oleiphilus]
MTHISWIGEVRARMQRSEDALGEVKTASETGKEFVMLNIKYIKVAPTTYLMQFKKGQVKRKGTGLALWYYAPSTSLVAIPTGTSDLPFIFKETTKDYQEVTVQGQLVYRIAEPEKLSSLMNFTLKSEATSKDLSYQSDDPDKLRNRILNLIQVKMSAAIEQMELRESLAASQDLVRLIKSELSSSEVINTLGLEVIDFSIVAIKPAPETARALEATVREQLLEQADDAIYKRRNASIEQERVVKENELSTELAVEAKQREIKEEKLKAERSLQEQRRQMKKEQLVAEVEQEEQRQELVELATENSRKQADAKAYDIAATMEALSKVDAKVLEAMTMGNLDPQQLLAQAFRELAGGADKIGQLNIAPDLLQSISGRLQQ